MIPVIPARVEPGTTRRIRTSDSYAERVITRINEIIATMNDLRVYYDERRPTGLPDQIAGIKRNAMKIIHMAAMIWRYICMVVITRSNGSKTGSDNLADMIYPA
jgi:hypothetical protein